MNRLREVWQRLPDSMRWGIRLFVMARVALWLWGGLVLALMPLPELPLDRTFQPAVPTPTGLLGWLLGPWVRWDVLWFSRIAVEGYGIADGRGAFGPLLPALINLVGGLLGGQYVLAAFLVSDLSCLGSLILLYEIAQRDGYDGRRSLIALLAYPFAFFLFIPYTESLLLFLTLVAFLAARSGRWWLVGLSGALAVLNKITALALIPPLAWELWESRRKQSLWNGLWLAVLPVAAIGWRVARILAFTTLRLDFSSSIGLFTLFLGQDYDAWLGHSSSWPWDMLVAAVMLTIQRWPHPHAVITAIDLGITPFVLYLTVLSFRIPCRSYAVYVAVTIVMNLMLIVEYMPLQDTPRRWMMAFPLFMAAAAHVPPRLTRPLVFLSVLLQALLSMGFVRWFPVG